MKAGNVTSSHRGSKSPGPAEPPPAEGTLLFLTGWPACGLSDFGAWLEVHRGYKHLDLDDDSPAEHELREAWARLLPKSPGRLLGELRARADRWVVTGENPADHLPYLGVLREAGFGVWFLQPRMEGHSRQRWLARERELDPATKSAAWDRLADAIRKNARELRPHFRNRCVDALAAEGQLSFETMAEAMHLPQLA